MRLSIYALIFSEPSSLYQEALTLVISLDSILSNSLWTPDAENAPVYEWVANNQTGPQRVSAS